MQGVSELSLRYEDLPLAEQTKERFVLSLARMQNVSTPLFNEAVKHYTSHTTEPKINPKVRGIVKKQHPRKNPLQCSRMERSAKYRMACDSNTHYCMGCGKSMPHGINACYECCKEQGIEFLPLRNLTGKIREVGGWVQIVIDEFEYLGSDLTKFNEEWRNWELDQIDEAVNGYYQSAEYFDSLPF